MSTTPSSGAADAVQAQLDMLKQLERPALAQRWAACFGCPAPRGVHAELLRQVLSWHLQAQALGGLTAAEQRQLRGTSASPLAPGSRLIRVWQGQTYQVNVLEVGFLYDGTRYRSLSAIAQVITGTRWSGPVFFGLKR